MVRPLLSEHFDCLTVGHWICRITVVPFNTLILATGIQSGSNKRMQATQHFVVNTRSCRNIPSLAKSHPCRTSGSKEELEGMRCARQSP